MVSRVSSSSFLRRCDLANLSQNTSKFPEWRGPQQKWQDSPGERCIQGRATRMHIATTSKFAIIRCKLSWKTYVVLYACCTRAQACCTETTPRASRRFPRGRTLSGGSEEGDRGHPVAARPPGGARRGLHSPHLHGAASRQAVAAFETLHYHVLPGWLDHPTLHGGSLTTVARGTALTGASGRAYVTTPGPAPGGAGNQWKEGCEEDSLLASSFVPSRFLSFGSKSPPSPPRPAQ